MDFSCRVRESETLTSEQERVQTTMSPSVSLSVCDSRCIHLLHIFIHPVTSRCFTRKLGQSSTQRRRKKEHFTHTHTHTKRVGGLSKSIDPHMMNTHEFYFIFAPMNNSPCCLYDDVVRSYPFPLLFRLCISRSIRPGGALTWALSAQADGWTERPSPSGSV